MFNNQFLKTMRTMENIKLQEWALTLIEKFNHEWCKKVSVGYTIFYSPVYLNPDLMVIGDNPGGSEINRQEKLPIEHEYFNKIIGDYPLAKIMREKIFYGEHLKNLLKNSIKLNRIFFKTKNLTEFKKLSNSLALENYCFEIVEQIIEKTNPKMIFAESFKTFRILSPKVENVILKKSENGKALILEGCYKNIKVIGINHPSRASYHKINDNGWKMVNLKLNDYLLNFFSNP